MRITVNGQLLLVMLMEDICEQIPGARPVMINTDGAEIIIPRGYEDKYTEICEKWEKQTMLNLEYENYQKLITPDINNRCRNLVNCWNILKLNELQRDWKQCA